MQLKQLSKSSTKTNSSWILKVLILHQMVVMHMVNFWLQPYIKPRFKIPVHVSVPVHCQTTYWSVPIIIYIYIGQFRYISTHWYGPVFGSLCKARDKTTISEITVAVKQIQICYFLEHWLAIVQMFYGSWWVKNSNFWMFIPIILQRTTKINTLKKNPKALHIQIEFPRFPTTMKHVKKQFCWCEKHYHFGFWIPNC